MKSNLVAVSVSAAAHAFARGEEVYLASGDIISCRVPNIMPMREARRHILRAIKYLGGPPMLAED